MSIKCNTENYVVAEYVNHDTKEFAVTRRIPEKSGCKVIDDHGSKSLEWAWLCANAPDKPWLNGWPILAYEVDRKTGDNCKNHRVKYWRDMMRYTQRNIKNFV